MRDVFNRIFSELLAVSIEAEVTGVDRKENTCDVAPLNGGCELFDVMLRADDGNSKGNIVYPSVGSIVIISPLDNSSSQYFVSMFSEVDEVVSTIETTTLSVDAGGVTIARGNDDLKSVLLEFINQMMKIYAAKDAAGIAKLKNRINNLLKSV